MTSYAPNLEKSGDLHWISVSLTHVPGTVISDFLPSVKRTETMVDCLKSVPVIVMGVRPVTGPVAGETREMA